MLLVPGPLDSPGGESLPAALPGTDVSAQDGVVHLVMPAVETAPAPATQLYVLPPGLGEADVIVSGDGDSVLLFVRPTAEAR